MPSFFELLPPVVRAADCLRISVASPSCGASRVAVNQPPRSAWGCRRRPSTRASCHRLTARACPWRCASPMRPSREQSPMLPTSRNGVGCASAASASLRQTEQRRHRWGAPTVGGDALHRGASVATYRDADHNRACIDLLNLSVCYCEVVPNSAPNPRGDCALNHPLNPSASAGKFAYASVQQYASSITCTTRFMSWVRKMVILVLSVL